jgi:hypothetical protein
MTTVPGLAGLDWTPGEATAVHEFLNSPVGRKWLGILLSRKPRLDLSSTERAALSGAYAAGYEAMFGEISATRVALKREETPSIRAIDPTRD